MKSSFLALPFAALQLCGVARAISAPEASSLEPRAAKNDYVSFKLKISSSGKYNNTFAVPKYSLLSSKTPQNTNWYLHKSTGVVWGFDTYWKEWNYLSARKNIEQEFVHNPPDMYADTILSAYSFSLEWPLNCTLSATNRLTCAAPTSCDQTGGQLISCPSPSPVTFYTGQNTHVQAILSPHWNSSLSGFSEVKFFAVNTTVISQPADGVPVYTASNPNTVVFPKAQRSNLTCKFPIFNLETVGSNWKDTSDPKTASQNRFWRFYTIDYDSDCDTGPTLYEGSNRTFTQNNEWRLSDTSQFVLDRRWGIVSADTTYAPSGNWLNINGDNTTTALGNYENVPSDLWSSSPWCTLLKGEKFYCNLGKGRDVWYITYDNVTVTNGVCSTPRTYSHQFNDIRLGTAADVKAAGSNAQRVTVYARPVGCSNVSPLGPFVV